MFLLTVGIYSRSAQTPRQIAADTTTALNMKSALATGFHANCGKTNNMA